MSNGGLAASTSAFFQAQPWEEHTEALLQEWASLSVKRSKAHEKLAERFRIAKGLNVLLILLAIVMASLATHLFIDKWVTMAAFLVLGIGQGLMAQIDPSGKLERHLNFAGRYMDLASDIAETLARPTRCRPPADVFCMRIKTVYESLNRNAPYVPELGSRFQLATALISGNRSQAPLPDFLKE